MTQLHNTRRAESSMEASDNVTFDSVIVLGFQSFFPTLFKFKPFVIFFFSLTVIVLFPPFVINLISFTCPPLVAVPYIPNVCPVFESLVCFAVDCEFCLLPDRWVFLDCFPGFDTHLPLTSPRCELMWFWVNITKLQHHCLQHLLLDPPPSGVVLHNYDKFSLCFNFTYLTTDINKDCTVNGLKDTQTMLE